MSRMPKGIWWLDLELCLLHLCIIFFTESSPACLSLNYYANMHLLVALAYAQC